MKRKVMALFLGATILVAFKTINDVVTDVGSTLEEVKQITLEQIAKKDFDLPRYTAQIRDACKKLPPGVRESTMMNLGNTVKDYVQSASFQSDYMTFVENKVTGRGGFASMGGRGPATMGGRAPASTAGGRGPAPTSDDMSTREKKRRMEGMKRSMSNPDLVKMYADNLDLQMEIAQSTLDLYKESPNLKHPTSKEEAKKQYEDAKMLKELYAKDVEAFKIKYAEYSVDQQLAVEMKRDKEIDEFSQKKIDELKDYKSIIASQLRQFLDLSATVDFNAKTIKKGNVIVFTNPAYEAKPASWKLCFRSGKEAVTGARKFANQWLKEINAGK